MLHELLPHLWLSVPSIFSSHSFFAPSFTDHFRIKVKSIRNKELFKIGRLVILSSSKICFDCCCFSHDETRFIFTRESGSRL